MAFDYTDEPYEAVTVAIAHLDAAIDTLGHSERTRPIYALRTELNHERLELLGNGRNRPFWVGEALQSKEPSTDGRS